MFALAAVVVFAVAFVLKLLAVSTGHIDLVVLGLLLMSLQMAIGWSIAIRRP